MHIAESEQAQLSKQQIQVFNDLKHQLRSPINSALQHAQKLLGDPTLSDEQKRLLHAVRGLCAKSKHVAHSAGMFADLAAGQEIKRNLQPLIIDQLRRLLIEMAQNTQMLIAPGRNIRIHVDRDSFDNVPRLSDVQVDYDLLEQAVSNLLDNAGKYSFAKTEVRIFGGLTGSERFHITVANTGLPIRPAEVREVTTRGWRSERASQVTGEGSGIGLWIVEAIMKAHDGDIVIVPTNDAGITEIKLIFPKRKERAS